MLEGWKHKVNLDDQQKMSLTHINPTHFPPLQVGAVNLVFPPLQVGAVNLVKELVLLSLSLSLSLTHTHTQVWWTARALYRDGA